MKDLRKVCSLLLATIGCGTTMLAAGCGNIRNNVIVNEQTVNIQLMLAGYGDSWIYDLSEKFEAAYQEQGYKVNILEPSNAMKGGAVVQEMYRGNKATGIDLYITGMVYPDDVGEKGSYGVLAEDLYESVYNKPAVNYNGEEEDVLIKDKISADILPYTQDATGAYYGFNWAQSVGGLVVNKKKLDRYGLEKPVTTNELLDCFEKIYLGTNGVENSHKSKTYPVTYVSGLNGYVNCIFNLWMAQYDPEAYKEFWSMQKIDEQGNVTDMIEDGAKVFETKGVTYMLDLAYRVMDSIIAVPGSTTQKLDEAQSKVMKENGDNAVFMFNGDWMFNEVRLNYKDKLGNIEFINAPILSAIGVELFGDGTSYNFDAEKCDELLSYIATLVDQNKTIEEIIALTKQEKNVEITTEIAKRISRARGTYFSRGIEHMAYVNKDAVGKEVAMEFLRMMASDDFAQTFAAQANSATPYASSSNVESSYEFVRQASAITANKYVRPVVDRLVGLRKSCNIYQMLPSISHLPSHIYPQAVSKYNGMGGIKDNVDDEIYVNKATETQNLVVKFVDERWDDYLKVAGIK